MIYWKEVFDKIPGNGYKSIAGFVVFLCSIVGGALRLIGPDLVATGVVGGLTLMGVGVAHKKMKGEI